MSNTNKLIDLDRLSRFWDKVKDYISTALGNKQNKTVFLTQAEYDALIASGGEGLEPNTDYIITDASSLEYTAQDLSYDGTSTTTYEKIEKASYYKVGDVIDFTDSTIMFAGLALSSTLRFTIPLDKQVHSNVTKITVSGPWFIYSAGTRYLNGGPLTDIGTVYTYVTNNWLNISITFSGISPTANEPAILRSGSGGKITFTTE